MGKVNIIDVDEPGMHVSKKTVQPLPDSFGKSLDTVERARQWLTNPHNWHHPGVFIIKWNGLVPTVDEVHGRQLLAEPWDNSLPAVVVSQQQRRRERGCDDDEAVPGGEG